MLAVADQDAFNWGYDPVHYGVPEGSYATNPDGPSRIKEFRGMVSALHSMGLRVVLDVVYNHTFHSGMDGRKPSTPSPTRNCSGTAGYGKLAMQNGSSQG